MTYSPSIAAEIRAEMARQRYPLVRLATNTGIPRSRLNRRINGTTPFNTDELRVIAAALNITVTDVYTRAGAA